MSLTSRVTTCCNKPVMRINGREYPDGRTFYISTSTDVCSSCKIEWPSTLESCECCGDGKPHLITTSLGQWCELCLTEHASDLMEKA